MRLTPEQKKQRTMERAQKALKWIDPAAAQHVTSLADAGHGPAAGLRQAERENATLRLLEQLLAEQRETNRLLAALAERAPAGHLGGHAGVFGAPPR